MDFSTNQALSLILRLLTGQSMTVEGSGIDSSTAMLHPTLSTTSSMPSYWAVDSMKPYASWCLPAMLVSANSNLLPTDPNSLIKRRFVFSARYYYFIPFFYRNEEAHNWYLKPGTVSIGSMTIVCDNSGEITITKSGTTLPFYATGDVNTMFSAGDSIIFAVPLMLTNGGGPSSPSTPVKHDVGRAFQVYSPKFLASQGYALQGITFDEPITAKKAAALELSPLVLTEFSSDQASISRGSGLVISYIDD